MSVVTNHRAQVRVAIRGWNSPDRARLLRFGTVGVATSGSYLALAALFGLAGVPQQIASIVAFVLAVAAQFFLHKHFTFKNNSGYVRDAWRFIVVVGIGAAFSIFVVNIGERAAWPTIVPNILVVIVTPIVNWLGFSLWVFVRKTL
ncbi:MAG: GtrA family protein [Devosia nanyangense]|uniref:GtrA family protein n=1 Tax=Devosia nanyangense TaxID=1228055 RepID=A0A933KZL9_9HYPH|nr:GtrA family protein [Devosia nanyangense]